MSLLEKLHAAGVRYDGHVTNGSLAEQLKVVMDYAEFNRYFSLLSVETQHWMILGTQRYMLWAFMDRPSLAEFYAREKSAQKPTISSPSN